MAILDIITYPNPLLKKVSQPIESVVSDRGKKALTITPEHKKLASDMLETMYKASGIGLSAIQVGQPLRLLVIDIRMLYNGTGVSDSPHSVNEQNMTTLEKQVKYPLILFNPVITLRKDRTSYREGCLSLPGFFETVERSQYVEVEGFNEMGEFF